MLGIKTRESSVENSKTATVTRLQRPERELSGAEHWELFAGGRDVEDYYTQEKIEFESAWGDQHAGVLQNFAANTLHGTPLLAPGSVGITAVRLANAIRLLSWLGKEVGLDFDEEEFLALLNDRIRDEGLFPVQC